MGTVPIKKGTCQDVPQGVTIYNLGGTKTYWHLRILKIGTSLNINLLVHGAVLLHVLEF